jgi:CheY-like chemotaxis protein
MANARFAPDRELSGVRVLVADDDDDLLELFVELLSVFGIEVSTARSGEEAFAEFLARRPDVIISDIQMPNGTGYDLIRKVRALPPEQGGLTPAVAMSGRATPDDTALAGFHVHVTKPPHAQELIDVVRSFVRDDLPGSDTWTIRIDDDTITATLRGHLSAVDVRACMTAIVRVLDSRHEAVNIVSDMRHLESFSPSVTMVAEAVVWRSRSKIASLHVLGGSPLARTVTRGACKLLGIHCSLD